MKRAVAAMVLAYLVPGAGHFFLGRRGRAAAFFAIVTFMFLVGIAIDGSLYVLSDSRGQALSALASLGSMGAGPLYFLGRAFGPEGSIRSEMFEYGRTFTLTAGLMNLLLVLDCWDIAVRRKAQHVIPSVSEGPGRAGRQVPSSGPAHPGPSLDARDDMREAP